jgi:outer membrane protein assembly factor BamB
VVIDSSEIYLSLTGNHAKGSFGETPLGEELFRMNAETGEVMWRYSGGMIIHSSIAIADGEIYFAEDRAPSDASLAKGRLVNRNGTDQFLVSLDLFEGTKKWEKQPPGHNRQKPCFRCGTMSQSAKECHFTDA